ncbi:siderophore-interacting protein [Agromyces sp. S2-1-8]|uniref:siderophore-interacting protein n=1 Tax=unclassified Agromyces TaxID=2639701 RepID=UPI001E585976|nr:siderophore-interacting protein [Agromyces sp. S2-1-8]MCD5347685.1 siderophore-interacting protein [Agromyces sp. S2-1-8]
MAKPGYRVFETVVGEIRRMSPHFVRVTFRGDDLNDVGWDGPDQRIKVVLPLEGVPEGDDGFGCFPRGDDWFGDWRALPDERRNPIRTYTIRDARPETGELDVDFVAHGDSGPASRWIARAEPGERMLLVAPDATSDEPPGGWEWHPGTAGTLLIAGDETAVPAMSAILAQLPASARGAAFLEVPAAGDVLDIEAPPGVVVQWLHRGGDEHAEATYGARLVEAVRAWADDELGARGAARAEAAAPADAELPALADDEILWEVPEATADDGVYAWLAGEATAITTLRRHLVKGLGVDRRRVAFMGYWKLGRAEG